MKLKKTRKVSFDPICHQYICGDKQLIGVTSLMRKHGLSPDYSDIPTALLEKAAEKGTALHRLLEDYDDGKPLVLNSDSEKKTINDYKKLGLDHIASEYLVSDFKVVASFIDKVYARGENQVEICDVKTTSLLHEDALSWQLSIYKYLFSLLNPNIDVVALTVLWFDKNTGALKRYAPIREIPEEKVKELLACEEMELPFVLDKVDSSVSLALPESEISEFYSVTQQIAALKITMDALCEKKKEFDTKVLGYMIKEGLTTLSSPIGVFKMRKGSIRTTIDSKRLKDERPEVYDEYSKESETSPNLIFTPNEI